MKPSALFLILCFLVVGYATFEYSTFSLNQARPFDADEAHHAARGLDVYDGITEGSISNLALAIRDQSFYPPLHSLTVAASYLSFGSPSLVSSRAPSWIAFVLSLFVTALAVRATLAQQSDFDSRNFAAYGMGVALLFGFFSPLSIQNASVCMLEPLSMLMTAILLYYFARYQRLLTYSKPAAVSSGLLLFLVALTKYTLIPFVVAPALVALWGIPRFTPKLAHRSALISGITVGVGFTLWLLVSHPEGVWYFLFGFPKRGATFSLAGLFTQPEMFMLRCALHPLLAALALLIAVISLKFIRAQRVILFSVLCIAATLAILGISKQQGGRFMLHALPCVWLLCGVGAARLAAFRPALVAFPYAILAVFVLNLQSERARIESDILRALETTPADQEMLTFATISANPSQPILQIGSSDRFNIEGVRWSLAAAYGLPFRSIQVDQFPMTVERFKNLKYAQPWRAPFDRARAQISQPLQTVIEQGGYKTLLVFEGERWLRQAENRAQLDAIMATQPHKTWQDEGKSLTVVNF
ncbi:MAG: hypothetical protein J0M12_04280 [Deltaproteobacteria bacterium]|nr:hypothetical protein [Deltaproteobacteria bacterium]